MSLSWKSFVLPLATTLLLAAGCGRDEPSETPRVAGEAPQEPAAEPEAEAAGHVEDPDVADGQPPAVTGQVVAPQVEPLAGLSVEKFKESYLTDIDATDRPAREVLAEVLEPLGLPIAEDADFEQLDAPLTLQLTDVSRLQAVEEICQAVGLTPIYPDFDPPWPSAGPGWLAPDDGKPKVLNFRSGARETPVAYAGPALIEVLELVERAPNTTGAVNLAVRIFGLPAAVAVANEDSVPFSIEAVEGPGGKELRQSPSSATLVAWDGGDFRAQPGIPLVGLLRDVDQIARIAGRVALRVPTKVETHSLRVEEGGVLQAANAEIKLTKLQARGDRTAVHFRYSGEGMTGGLSQWQLEFFDAAGKPLSHNLESDMSSGGNGQSQISMEGRPATLVAIQLAAVEDVHFPWEFGGIPLQKASQQPAQLDALSFAGDAAVTAEVTKRSSDGLARIHIKVVNHSNKDIQSLVYTLRHLDAAGRMIKADDGIESGFPDEPLVAKNSEDTIEVPAFFMPKETADTHVKLKNATFTDGTEWDATVLPLKDDAPYDPEQDPPVAAAVDELLKENVFTKVFVTLANRSNKPAAKVNYTLHYLNAAGEELKTHEAQLEGEQTEAEGVVVPARSQRELSLTAFFMPEEATQVTVSIGKVTYADGQTWEEK